MKEERLTDSELARELAGYVLHKAELHLGLRGAEIDMDQEVYRMEQMLSELRSDFELGAESVGEPPRAEPPRKYIGDDDLPHDAKTCEAMAGSRPSALAPDLDDPETWKGIEQSYETAPAPSERDNCQICEGWSGGVRGNENIIDGIRMCDYCSTKIDAYKKLLESSPVDPREPIVQKRTLEEKVNEIRKLVGAIHTKLFAGEEALAELLTNLPKCESVDPREAARKSGIYVASKTRHAAMWRKYRETYPIISTWIDEAEVGQTKSFEDLWIRCIHEATHAERVILFAASGDELKGALIEAGAALGAGVPVFVLGDVPQLKTATNHPLVIPWFTTVEQAFTADLAAFAAAVREGR